MLLDFIHSANIHLMALPQECNNDKKSTFLHRQADWNILNYSKQKHYQTYKTSAFFHESYSGMGTRYFSFLISNTHSLSIKGWLC